MYFLLCTTEILFHICILNHWLHTLHKIFKITFSLNLDGSVSEDRTIQTIPSTLFNFLLRLLMNIPEPLLWATWIGKDILYRKWKNLSMNQVKLSYSPLGRLLKTSQQRSISLHQLWARLYRRTVQPGISVNSTVLTGESLANSTLS